MMPKLELEPLRARKRSGLVNELAVMISQLGTTTSKFWTWSHAMPQALEK